MLLETFDMTGSRKEWTEAPGRIPQKCVPSKSAFLQKTKDGYIFKLDGKVIKTYEKLLEALGEN